MNMKVAEDRIRVASDAIESMVSCSPSVALVLGSGLSGIVDQGQTLHSIPYEDIPGFPQTTVEGHNGVLHVVRFGRIEAYVMQGRFHYYEGFDIRDVTFPVRVLAALGTKKVVLTNAAGGMDPDMQPGDLMVITDHFSFFCRSPLIGPNNEKWGPRFPDQTHVYTPEYVDRAVRIAEENNIRLHKGVYAYSTGPQYETPAEIRALLMLGASAVGMSTVPEAIVASHAGMKIVGISCISNLASGLSPHELTHSEVVENAAHAAKNTITLIRLMLEEIEK